MNRDDVIRMAREAGFEVMKNGAINDGVETAADFSLELQHFAQLVAAQAAAEEQEACAKVCKEIADSEKLAWHEITATACARAIRNRGAA